MPDRVRVAALVEMVEADRFVDALRAFYHPDATMQENNEPPRGGLDVLVAGEEALLARFASIHTQPGSTFVLDGDVSVVRWRFTFTWLDGSADEFEELAHQLWRGDRIVRERFFYDSAQLRAPATPTTA